MHYYYELYDPGKEEIVKDGYFEASSEEQAMSLAEAEAGQTYAHCVVRVYQQYVGELTVTRVEDTIRLLEQEDPPLSVFSIADTCGLTEDAVADIRDFHLQGLSPTEILEELE